MDKSWLSRNFRLMAVVGGTIAVLIIAYLLRTVLFPFLIGLGFAYMFSPFISRLESFFSHKTSAGSSRLYSIAVIYFVVVIVMGFLAFTIFQTIVDALHTLATNSNNYLNETSDTLKQWTDNIRDLVPTNFRGQVDAYIQEASDGVSMAASNAVHGMVNQTLSMLLGLVAVPFFLFYVLKDREKIGQGFYAGLPAWSAVHVRNILRIIEQSFGRYIRASMTLAVAVFLLDFIGLLIMRHPMAPLLAVFAGITEMAPVIGPWAAGIVAAIVTLALAPEKIVWVIVLFAGVQMLENIFLVPRIQSSYFKLNPALTIVILTLGAYLDGIWGLILVLPLTDTAIGLYRYCSRAASEPEVELEEVRELREQAAARE